MPVISIREAKSTLSLLVKRAAAREIILIETNGKADAQLGPLAKNVRKKSFGMLAGKLKVPEDFDTALPSEVLDDLERKMR
jgi:antitoxin (DNA-binding transcriptional repressor) of toxin-antitoxin stability system